jgi:hypothetical protein
MPSNEAPYEYCCKVFPVIMPDFKWMTVTIEGKVFMCLPNIESQNPEKPNLYHVNYCPSCGKYIRGILIEKDEFMSHQS